jgi:hypothetical protein
MTTLARHTCAPTLTLAGIGPVSRERWECSETNQTRLWRLPRLRSSLNNDLRYCHQPGDEHQPRDRPPHPERPAGIVFVYVTVAPVSRRVTRCNTPSAGAGRGEPARVAFAIHRVTRSRPCARGATRLAELSEMPDEVAPVRAGSHPMPSSPPGSHRVRERKAGSLVAGSERRPPQNRRIGEPALLPI